MKGLHPIIIQKIRNITYMHNFIIKNNGTILSNNINRSIINNINNSYNRNINTTNNNLTPISYNYQKTNNTNYLIEKYNLTSKNNILYTMAFTDNFTKYRVEIGDIIINKGNKNISEVYANIVPKNSSKILYGNEFTINYRSSYGNQMKALINSIYLSSLYYMNSNNITMHKFGIENNYISMAMNSMLGKTNNTVKSMNISETNAVIIDSYWWCAMVLTGEILALISVVSFFAAFIIGTDGAGITLLIALQYLGYGALIASLGVSIYITVDHCNW